MAGRIEGPGAGVVPVLAAFDEAGTKPAMLVIGPPPVDWPGWRRGSAPPETGPADVLAGGALAGAPNGGEAAGAPNDGWPAGAPNCGDPPGPPKGGALAGAAPLGEANGGAPAGAAPVGEAKGGAPADCGLCFPAQAGSTGASAGL